MTVRENVIAALEEDLSERDLALRIKYIAKAYIEAHAALMCMACETKTNPMQLVDGTKCPVCGHDQFYTDVSL
jgi:DNA-directed RNA polymerase subunit RPC12/RpoP